MKMKSLCLIGVVHLVSLHEGVMRICEKGDSRRELLFRISISDGSHSMRVHNKQN